MEIFINWNENVLIFDKIFIIGCIERCQNDNFQCSQWWKFQQNDNITISVFQERRSLYWQRALGAAMFVIQWSSRLGITVIVNYWAMCSRMCPQIHSREMLSRNVIGIHGREMLSKMLSEYMAEKCYQSADRHIHHVVCHNSHVTPLLVKLEYGRITMSIPWMLMPWLLASPGHQQPRYWLYRIYCPVYM